MQTYCSRCRRYVAAPNGKCPDCADTTGDQIMNRLLVLGVWVGVAAGCVVGILIPGHYLGTWLGFCIGGFMGGFCGGLVGMVCGADCKKNYDTLWRKTASAKLAVAAVPASTLPKPAPALDFAAVALREEERLLASGLYRKCPHCAEVVKAEANRCRFCQESVKSAR